MDAEGDLTIFSGKLTILMAFSSGGELDKTCLRHYLSKKPSQTLTPNQNN